MCKAIVLTLSIFFLTGCALKVADTRDDGSYACINCDPGLGYRVGLTQPSVCNDYPVEYRRELPDDVVVLRGTRFRLFTKKPSLCDEVTGQ
jgi:hypothetical protein